MGFRLIVNLVRKLLLFIKSSVQWLSHVQLFVTPWTAAHQAYLSITNSRSLLKLMFSLVSITLLIFLSINYIIRILCILLMF